MATRKILIATPIKGDIPPEYVKTLFETILSRIPDTKFMYSFLGGTTVQWARDELASIATKAQCTHLLFWDKDMEPTVPMMHRLLSHDEEIVIGLYSKRSLNTHWHVTGIPGEEERKDGLMRVQKGAIGFSLIKMTVFEKLRAKFPERAYWKHDGGEEPITLHEFFPMGILGPNSHVGKLERIRAIAKDTFGMPEDYHDGFNEIESVLNDTDYSSNAIAGEDYYFCQLLAEAGVPLYLDTQLIVPHNAEVQLPIHTTKLLEMLKEPWRADEVRALQADKPVEQEVIPS